MLIAKLEIRIEDIQDRDLSLDREEQVEAFLDDLRDAVYEAVGKRKSMLPDGYDVEIQLA